MNKSLITLLIDDDLDDQEFFSIVMEENFPQVQYEFANDGIQALGKLTAESSFIPHIIFIDVNMPRMNGLDCLKEIKKISRLEQAHIYMYSTSGDPAMVKRSLDLGARGFIRKEATLEALQKRFSEVIAQLNIPSL